MKTLHHFKIARAIVYYFTLLVMVPVIAFAQSESLTAFETPLQRIFAILTSNVAMLIVAIATVVIGVVIIVGGGQNVKSKLIALGGGGILIFSSQAIVKALFIG